MTPALSNFLASDPEVVPLVRLFHLNFGSVEYYLNESNLPIQAGGQTWEPCYGWVEAEPLEGTTNPFDANPAYYNVWNVDNLEGQSLAYAALNEPELWAMKSIRQLWTVRGFPNDAIVMHVGFIADVRPAERNESKVIRIRAEPVTSARNYTPLGEYTSRDQARRYPNIVDKGCDYAPSLVGKTIKGWLVG